MILEIKNLSKSFDNNMVLDNVNLSLTSGKIYGIIGRNGSGKSVLLKIICGYYVPSSGEVLLDGKDYMKSLKLLASIQNRIDDNDILRIIDKLNLSSEKDKIYAKYSLGTKQKLGIAQVLMENPDIIILDEPLNGIEKLTAEKIREILKEEKEKGKLIIIASHIKEDIDFLADEVYEIDSGKVIKIK